MRFLGWLKGNTDALDFVQVLHSITHVWDDLIDKDKPITDAAINGAFFDSLITLQRNPFYNQHADELIFLMEQGIRDWFTSNKLMADKNYEAAFVLRTSLTRVFSHCAFIIGGNTWGQNAADEMNALALDDLQKFMDEQGSN